MDISYIKSNRILRGLCTVALGVLCVSAASQARLPQTTTRTLLIKVQEPVDLAAASSAVTLSRTGMPQLDALLGQRAIAAWRPLTPAPHTARSARRSSAREELQKWLTITLADSADGNAVRQRLLQEPFILHVEENRVFRLDDLPNDPRLSEQAGLKAVSAFKAWDIEKGSAEISVGVIDTGIDYNHPDLRGNIWINAGEDLNHNGALDPLDFNGIDDDGNGYIDDIIGWDFTDAPNYPDGGDYRQRDADPMDENGHGTGVAGIIAAVTDNGVGMAGVAPGCRLMCLRAFTSGGYGEEDDVCAAIIYAIDNGARVINMSWGDVFVSRLLDDVIHFAASENVVCVSSAGNAATDQVHYPSAFTNTISVGATDDADNLASFSNFGPSLDLVAPGVNILSTKLGGDYGNGFSGTSFAAPFVSAGAALLLSQNPGRDPDAVRSLLIVSADDLGTQGWDAWFGAGRLNIFRALSPEPNAAVRITAPWLDHGFSSGPIEIRGSAWTPSLQAYTLSYGAGENPDTWFEIQPASPRRVLDGLLGLWHDIPAVDSDYTIRLQVKNRDGSLQQSAVRIFIDHTPPVISQVECLPMYDGERASVLIQCRTDDLSEGAILYRPAGSSGAFQEVKTSYRSYEPRLNFSTHIAAGMLDMRVRSENAAGLVTITDETYTIDLSGAPLNTMRYSPRDAHLPHGHLLDVGADFDQDGTAEIVIGYQDENNQIRTALYTRTSSGYRELFILPEPMIPRSVGDSDGDGRLELLCGYGMSTFLYEANPGPPFRMDSVMIWRGSPALQYWGSRLADLNGDGRSEVIMRIVNSSNATYVDEFQVWERLAGGHFSAYASLPNFTSGDNLNSVPRCETGDFDNDGYQEILLGDSDGDIYIYEAHGRSFVPVWQDRLPLQDATDFICSGDFDGDGVPEFAAGCHSDPSLNSEHAYDARHWLYRIYDRNGNNSYRPVAEWRFFGYESPKDFDSGISSGDADGDGREEIFICVFPDLYVAEYEPTRAEYQLTFYNTPVQSNAVGVFDGDGDGVQEAWWSDGAEFHPWVLTDALSATAVPVGVAAKPVDQHSVVITWYPVSGAHYYQLYRGSAPDSLQPFSRTAASPFLDTLVVAGQSYCYAVSAVDSNRVPQESLKSRLAYATPAPRPALTAVVPLHDRALRVRFSRSMGDRIKEPAHFTVHPAAVKPSTCLPLASGQELLLNFSRPLSPGAHVLRVQDLEAEDGTPLDTLRNELAFEVSSASTIPYLSQAEMLKDHSLLLTFSEPMQMSALMKKQNYLLDEKVEITAIAMQGTEERAVALVLLGHSAWGAIGKPFTIRVKDMVSAAGVPMQTGRGDEIKLLFAAENVDRVFTFPNPFRQGLDHDGIVFANLTPSAEIRIMTSEGRTVRVLQEDNGDGGLTWDVCDELGRPVPSGIYLYRVQAFGASKMGKLAVVR